MNSGFQRKPSFSNLGPHQQQQPPGAAATMTNGQPPAKKHKSGLTVKFGGMR